MKPWNTAIVSSIIGFALFSSIPGRAAEIKVFAARAVAAVLEKVGPEFERSSGHKLNVIVGFGPLFIDRIKAGEAFDIFVSTAATIDALFSDEKLDAATRVVLLRTGIGAAVRAGAQKPDIDTAEKFKAALLAAGSIAYLKVGDVPALVTRLGIADAIRSRVTAPDNDIVAELVAKGTVELGVFNLFLIASSPGIDLVGPLPPELQVYSSFVAGVSAKSGAPEAAKSLLEFLRNPRVAPIIRSVGLLPG